MLRSGWIILILLLVAAGVSLVTSCRKTDSSSRRQVTPLAFSIPPGFPPPVYGFKNNPLTEEGFELGKKLFYDGRLSKDGNFPCASCHQQFAAFSTFDHPLSHGFNNQFTTRNAPGLFNLVWQKEFHWDGGINHIEIQPLAPITAPNEMAEDINSIIVKLEADPAYKDLFGAAFGDNAINSQRILYALTQFVSSMVSAHSKYDKMKRGEAVFNISEERGYALFSAKCASCHTEPLFTDLSYRNNGGSLHPQLRDFGRMIITGDRNDSLKFKVPSLRNVAITAPYGHDGRYLALSQVLNHYSEEVLTGPTLDPLLADKLPLTDVEKFYLREFLFTLTDSTFINDKRFAPPE